MVRSKGLHMLVLITEASYFNIMFFVCLFFFLKDKSFLLVASTVKHGVKEGARF
jgi:hypothetical protein